MKFETSKPPVLQERELKTPEKPAAKETSKEQLSEERKVLAREIKETRTELAKKNVERIGNRDKISEMRVRLAMLRQSLDSTTINWESSEKQYAELSARRAEQATTFAGRIKELFAQVVEPAEHKERRHALDEATAGKAVYGEQQKKLKEEIATLSALLESDDLRQGIKSKLKEHYATAEQVSTEQFERQQKTVENSLLRNDVFILHTLTTYEPLRHNANSPIKETATLEDDLDIALSLEPSLSTSSVGRGHTKELFQERFGNIGVVIGGGDIKFAHQGDAGTVVGSDGKRRAGSRPAPASVAHVDEVLSNKTGGYNEVVVENPKIFGIFKSVQIGKDGSFMTISHVKDFKDQMELARKKGLPQFVLTPDRRMFEYVSIAESGKVEIGKEIRPEDVAKGNAGLSKEDRKKIGEGVISKSLFKRTSHEEEARKQLASLT